MGGSDWLILEVIQPANPWQGQTSEPSLAANPVWRDDTSQRAGLIAPELRRVVYTFAPPESDAGDSLSSAVDEMAAADDTELVVGEEPETQPFGAAALAVATNRRLSRRSPRRRASPPDRATRRFACDAVVGGVNPTASVARSRQPVPTESSHWPRRPHPTRSARGNPGT